MWLILYRKVHKELLSERENLDDIQYTFKPVINSKSEKTVVMILYVDQSWKID